VRHVDAIGLFDGSRRYRRAQIVPITLELWTILKTTLAVLLRLALILRKSCAASRSFLRQFSIASHQGLDALVLWEFALRRLFRGFVRKLRAKHAKTQSIVTVESQLGVSWGDSTSCSSSRPPY
jgi:hypothetical protein